MSTVPDLSLRGLGTGVAGAPSRLANRRLHEGLAESAGSAETSKSTEKMGLERGFENHAETCPNLPKPSRAMRPIDGTARIAGGRQKGQEGQKVEKARQNGH